MTENNPQGTEQAAAGLPVIAALPAPLRIRAALAERGFASISAWARFRNIRPEEARMMAAGMKGREYPLHRERLAADLGITRSELDVWIDRSEDVGDDNGDVNHASDDADRDVELHGQNRQGWPRRKAAGE